MALAATRSVALVGLAGVIVEVEADLANGLPALSIVGLPDTALAESRDRVRAAVLNSRREWPSRRMTVSLSPANQRKAGSAFDLAIAVAIMAAAGVVPAAAVAPFTMLGELALDGRVRAVPGVLPAVLAAVAAGRPRVAVPLANLAEALLVPGVEAWGVRSLGGLLSRLAGECPADGDDVVVAGHGDDVGQSQPMRPPVPDLADVVGQADARRALEIAAAGGHNMFLHGPPGTGKTMLAQRLPGLMPDLDIDSALEVTAVHSVARLLPTDCPLLIRPPFQSPHHGASAAALVGGGSGFARPGSVSLAHRGVLFLDEAPEFSGGVLDALRQPLESGVVTIQRSGGAATYPARFQLVLAANPCPCARGSGDALECTCPPRRRRDYLARISAPLLDRVDLVCHVAAVSAADLAADRRFVEPTAVVAARVQAARELAAERFRGSRVRVNADMSGADLRGRWAPTRAARRRAERAVAQGSLTLRGLDRILRVAWTIADLSSGRAPDVGEVEEALALRHGAIGMAA